MTSSELSALVRGLAPTLRSFIAERVEKAVGDFGARMVALEQRMASVRDGKDGEPGAPGPPGRDGKDIDQDVFQAAVDAAVTKALAAIPKARDGKDGESVDQLVIEAMVAAHVEKAFAALPAPKDGRDGRSITVEDVAPLVSSEVAKAVAAIPQPKDGVGLAGALLDRDGHLVVTLSDGTAKDVGLVVGRDADTDAIRKAITEEVAKIPRPADGKDGKDGVGFDDIEEVLDVDGRTLIRRHIAGDRVKEFRHTLALVLDRGVFKQDAQYQKGDGVTWAGSYWIAQADTKGQKPGDGATAWRLAVKKGHDGKSGPKGERGEQGPQGIRGNDGRNGY